MSYQLPYLAYWLVINEEGAAYVINIYLSRILSQLVEMWDGRECRRQLLIFAIRR